MHCGVTEDDQNGDHEVKRGSFTLGSAGTFSLMSLMCHSCFGDHSQIVEEGVSDRTRSKTDNKHIAAFPPYEVVDTAATSMGLKADYLMFAVVRLKLSTANASGLLWLECRSATNGKCAIILVLADTTVRP